MGLPGFLLRRLYQRGSLRETGNGTFSFVLANHLGTATLVAPPDIVVNGVQHHAKDIVCKVDLAAISRRSPFVFEKGDEVRLECEGHLLRTGNRIHITALTREFGELDFLVEDREADFCQLSEEE